MRPSVLAALLCASPCCVPLKGSDERADATAQAQAVQCDAAEPPAPPDAANGGAAAKGAPSDTSDLVFAVSQIEYGAMTSDDGGPPEYPSIGFDLDHACTGVGSCIEPSWALGSHHGGPNGIDNAFGQVVAGQVPNSLPATWYYPEILLRLRGYAGQQDQDPVDVVLYIALGLTARQDGGVGPFWDGQDRWTILPESLVQPTTGEAAGGYPPRFHANRAYVTRGSLVAEFDETLWPSGLTNAPRILVTARKLLIAGALVQPGNAGSGWELRNLVVGFRSTQTDSLKLIGRSPTVFGGAYAQPDGGPVTTICQDPTLYASVKPNLCGVVDITAAPTAPPTATCDALSVGMRFQARQALLGTVAGPAPDPPPCAPGVPDPDTCDSLGP